MWKVSPERDQTFSFMASVVCLGRQYAAWTPRGGVIGARFMGGIFGGLVGVELGRI